MNASGEAIVITGASDGIGKELAKALASGGAKLGLIARRTDALEEVRLQCLAAGAREVFCAPADVADSASLRRALGELDEKLGGTTIFVANAGISGRTTPRKDGWEDARRCLQVNVLGAIDGLEWMKARMIERGGGTLVGVSSVAATRGLPDSGAYSASKAALTTYLESMRVDLKRHGMRVLTVAPGYIATELTKHNRGKMPFLISADVAGRVFARDILRRKKLIVAPWQFYSVIWLMRLMPSWLYEAVLDYFMAGVRGSRPEQR